MAGRAKFGRVRAAANAVADIFGAAWRALRRPAILAGLGATLFVMAFSAATLVANFAWVSPSRRFMVATVPGAFWLGSSPGQVVGPPAGLSYERSRDDVRYTVGVAKRTAGWPVVLSGAWGGLQVPLWMVVVASWIPWMFLMVRGVRRWWRRRRLPGAHCRVCTYDLTGNASGICPECGTPIDAPAQLRVLRGRRRAPLANVVVAVSLAAGAAVGAVWAATGSKPVTLVLVRTRHDAVLLSASRGSAGVIHRYDPTTRYLEYWTSDTRDLWNKPWGKAWLNSVFAFQHYRYPASNLTPDECVSRYAVVPLWVPMALCALWPMWVCVRYALRRISVRRGASEARADAWTELLGPGHER